MKYIFLKKGKAKDVFKALLQAALLEAKFGRIIEPLESGDFSIN